MNANNNMRLHRWMQALAGLVVCAVLASCGVKQADKAPLRLLYWNIQNGMWSGQGDNYDRFVEWVRQQRPDVCIWCEAQSLYHTGTAKPLPASERYLPGHWEELAARYGHDYCYVGGHRDGYPQVITSKYPIENVARIVGQEPDSVVTHGAGWARITVNRRTLNIVTTHLWPQGYAYRAADREASKKAHEGDKYRLMEMDYVCRHTIGTRPDAAREYWVMAGDFNARSRVDNAVYRYAENDVRLGVHDYIKENTPYVDVIAGQYPDEFKTTTGGQSRIDFVYCSPALYKSVVAADVLTDEYTRPVRDPAKLSNFWHPSDHRPILVEFDLGRLKPGK